MASDITIDVQHVVKEKRSRTNDRTGIVDNTGNRIYGKDSWFFLPEAEKLYRGRRYGIGYYHRGNEGNSQRKEN